MDKMEIFGSLQESPLLVALTDDQIRKVQEGSAVETHADDAVIVRRDSPGDALYLILKGRVLIESAPDMPITTLSGEKTMHEQYEGDFFGEMAILDHEPRSADVRAVGEAIVLKVSRDRLYELFATDTDLQVVLLTNVARILSRRLRRTTRRVR